MSALVWRCAAAIAILMLPPSVLASSEASEQTLQNLAQEYCDLGLPLPPPNAPPLLLPFNERRGNDGELVAEYVIGFRLTSDLGSFLVGAETWRPKDRQKIDQATTLLDPDKPLTAPLFKGLANIETFPTDIWLSAAAQCQISGYSKLATQILQNGASQLDHHLIEGWAVPKDEEDLSANHLLYDETNGGNPLRALDAAAWNCWLNDAFQPGSDRREVYARLEELATRDDALAGKARRDLLDSLRLTLQPATGQPGSPEALIDALTEDSDSSFEHPIPARGFRNPNLNKLLDLGFAAMPALVAHMNDRRLTRGLACVIDGPVQCVRIGDLVTQLVETAAGDQLFKQGTRPSAGEYDSAELAAEWWAKASTQGEEAYVCDHVFLPEKRADEYQWVNDYCLWIVAHHYPQHLSDIFERLVRERPELGVGEACDEVAECAALSREEKLRLLRMGADHPDLARREEALEALFKVDVAEADKRLLQELARLPNNTSQRKNRLPPEPDVSRLVRISNSRATWRALGKTARRVSPELRAGLIELAYDSFDDRDASKPQAVKFLRSFIDDNARFHDPSDPLSGQKGAQAHRVSDVALRQLIDALKIPDVDGIEGEVRGQRRRLVLAALETR